MISTTDERISCSSCWTGLCHRRERERKKEKAGHGLLLLLMSSSSSSSSSRREGAKRMTLMMSSLKNRLKNYKKKLNFFLDFDCITLSSPKNIYVSFTLKTLLANFCQ
jgi:hypothetical protein